MKKRIFQSRVKTRAKSRMKKSNWYVRRNKNVTFAVNPSNAAIRMTWKINDDKEQRPWNTESYQIRWLNRCADFVFFSLTTSMQSPCLLNANTSTLLSFSIIFEWSLHLAQLNKHKCMQIFRRHFIILLDRLVFYCNKSNVCSGPILI